MRFDLFDCFCLPGMGITVLSGYYDHFFRLATLGRQMNIRTVALFSTLFLLAGGVQAQNWRGENPNQPNGYRASEFASHYHGDLRVPAQQQNGYRASEARSHYGGSRFEPASGWSYSSNGNSSNYGRSWQTANSDSNRWGNQGGSADRVSGSYLGTARCLHRLGELRNLEASGGANQTAGGSYQGSNGEGVSRFGAMLGARREQRENAVQNMIRSGSGGFNHLYVGN